ncbi:nucleotide sugar dehydrogenase [Candidatus Kaiserbacteria bacterium]|nr:nucleotide sugar dehydrogenase [Candidatus Kaiserbacteria bacterium]
MKSYAIERELVHAPSVLDDFPSPLPSTSSIVVVGVGYVGLPLAILAASKKYRAIGFDIDEAKISRLTKRDANYITDEEQELLRKQDNISFTSREDDIWHASAYIICVPTPVKADHTPDLEPLKNASRIVGRHLSRGSLVVIESTVNPGACEDVALPILESESGLEAESDFYFAHCPERVNPGDVKWNVRTIPRVIGAIGEESLAQAIALYQNLLDAPLQAMPSIKEAEAVKMVENAFRDINIAFVNELAMSFDRAGIDLLSVIEGASSKPFAFMPHIPGCGVGGHCIPVDPYYLIRYGEKNGFEHRFLLTARLTNQKMPKYAVRRLSHALRQKKRLLRGSTVALLGLAYKKDIPDHRESPALEIEKELRAKGARVRTFDPFVPKLSSEGTLEDALQGADVAVIATDHTFFRALTPENFTRAGVDIIIDGRNCLDKKAFQESGVTYRGIGR